MEPTRHAAVGDSVGNSLQPNGKHRAGIGLIPVGNRDRCKIEYGINAVEDRDSDPNIRRI